MNVGSNKESFIGQFVNKIYSNEKRSIKLINDEDLILCRKKKHRGQKGTTTTRLVEVAKSSRLF